MRPIEVQTCAALFEGAFADVWRFVRRRVNTSSDADDLAAEVFAVAWRRWDDRPSVDSEHRPWLFGIARNLLLNHRRSIDRQHRLIARLSEERQIDPTPPPADTEQTLFSALAKLSEDDRDLLLMRAWDGLSVTDMAIVLECSANAVSLRLHKARARLRNHLNNDATEQKDSPLPGHGQTNPATERSTQ